MLLIDGYNLLFSPALSEAEGSGGKLSLETQRERLIARLTDYLAARGKGRIRLYFDSREGGLPYETRREIGRLAIHFADRDESADIAIVREAEKCDDRKNLRVVTDDREIRDALARLRVQVTRTQDFEEELETMITDGKRRQNAADAERVRYQGVDNERDVQSWLKEFGLPDEIEG